MPCGHALNVVFQDAAHLIRVIGVHDHHDRLLEKRIRLFIGLLLQGQQSVLSGNLGQLHQLVDICNGIESLCAENNLDMLWNLPEHLPWETGHHNEDGASDGDEDAGRVHEVQQVLWCYADRRTSS